MIYCSRPANALLDQAIVMSGCTIWQKSAFGGIGSFAQFGWLNGPQTVVERWRPGSLAQRRWTRSFNLNTSGNEIRPMKVQNSVYNSLSMSAAAALSDSAIYTLVGNPSFAAAAGFTPSSQAAFIAAVSMAATASLSELGKLVIAGAISMSAASAFVDAAGLLIAVQVAYNANALIADDTLLSMQAQVNLAAGALFTPNVQATLAALISLAATPGASYTGGFVINESIVASVIASLSAGIQPAVIVEKIYMRQVQTALRVIARKGQLCNWVKNDEVANPTQPWKSSEPGTPITYPVKICFFPPGGVLSESMEHLEKGTSVDMGGVRAIMGQTSFQPALNDKVQRGNTWLQVKAIDIVAPNGEVILYKLHFA